MGRNPKYSFEVLINHLSNFLEQHPNKELNPSELSRFSGVPRHIWRDNKQIKEVIKELNTSKIVADPDKVDISFPNAEQFVEAHYYNKPKLIQAVAECLELIHSLYDKALVGSKQEEREAKYKQQIAELQAALKQKDQEIVILNEEIDQLYIDSESPSKLKKQKLKDNLITLSTDHAKQLSKDMKDIRHEFNTLFSP